MWNMIESIDIKEYWKEFDTIWVWCDWLRLSYCRWSDFIDERLSILDTDNSNFGTCTINDFVFTYQKIPTPLWLSLHFSYSYNNVSVPVFEYVQFNENTKFITNRSGKLDFYGSFFRLWEIWEFETDLLLSTICFYISDEDPRVTRFDYRVDYFSRLNNISIPNWKDFVDIRSDCKVDPKYTWDVLTNWLVWKKDTGTYCIRLYNKLLDSDLKEKVFLYQDFFNYKTVQRLEFEFQRNFLKWYFLSDYFDWNIQNKIESILWFNDNFWSGAICYHYDSSEEITDKNRSSYIRRFSNMSLKLQKNWINPLKQVYEILYEEMEYKELESVVNDFLKEYVKNAKKDLYDKMIV